MPCHLSVVLKVVHAQEAVWPVAPWADVFLDVRGLGYPVKTEWDALVSTRTLTALFPTGAIILGSQGPNRMEPRAHQFSANWRMGQFFSSFLLGLSFSQ